MSDQINEMQNMAGEPQPEQENPQEVPAASKSVQLPKAMSGMGVCSILCGLFSFFMPLPALVGIGLALCGLKRDRRDKLCYIGLCVSCALLAFNLVKLVQVCSSDELAALYGSVSGADM